MQSVTKPFSLPVMRASGSYRVLFNTHLWAEMKCERANQKSIRITAQDRDDIAVFLITVSPPSYSPTHFKQQGANRSFSYT